uniref:Uncharacterized protein n=1 Tax=Globodera rostochiensis TaxID=31243 RepID=A0A914HVS6_GLORO
MYSPPFFVLFCLFLLNFVLAQWFGGGTGMGGGAGIDMGGAGGGVGGVGGGLLMEGAGGGGGGGEGGGGMGNEELNALEMLKNVMERRAQSNRQMREQLDRTNRELRGANDELKTTRDRIYELGTRCEQFGRIKNVLREKITEIEEIFSNNDQGGGGGGGGGGAGGGGRGGRGGVQFVSAAYGGGGGGAQEIWNSADESLTMPGMSRARRESAGAGDPFDDKQNANSKIAANIALCNSEPNIQHKLKQELDKAQQRITQLKGMERKISVSLFLARLF